MMVKVKKTKEQLAQEFQNKQEIAEMKSLAEKSIIPVLVRHNKTAYQATNVLEVMKQVALGKMNSAWADKPFKDLELAEELTADNDAQDRDLYADIIGSFDDMPTAKVMKMLDVLSRVIDMYANRQILQVRVGELPLDEMMK